MFGRARVPGVVKAVALEPGERRRSWALTASGDPVVATDLGLRLPGSPLLEWADVEKAIWKRPLLEVVQVSDVSGRGPRWRLQLEQEQDLPDTVRSAVSASVGWSTHVTLMPSGGVRAVGRRRPGREDLDWQLVYDPGTDLDDPQVQAQAQAVLLDARRTIG